MGQAPKSPNPPPFGRILASSGRAFARDPANSVLDLPENRCGDALFPGRVIPGAHNANGAGIAADPALTDVRSGGNLAPKRDARWPKPRDSSVRRSRRQPVPSGGEVRFAGRSPFPLSCHHPAVPKPFRPWRSRDACRSDEPQGFAFLPAFLSQAPSAPKCPGCPRSCGLCSVRLAPHFAPTSRDRTIRPYCGAPLRSICGSPISNPKARSQRVFRRYCGSHRSIGWFHWNSASPSSLSAFKFGRVPPPSDNLKLRCGSDSRKVGKPDLSTIHGFACGQRWITLE